MKNDRNDVKTRTHVKPILENIGIGRRDQTALFLTCYSQIRITIFIRLPCLHFYNDQLFAFLGDDVNFLVNIAPIPLNYLITFPDKKLSCDFFAKFS